MALLGEHGDTEDLKDLQVLKEHKDPRVSQDRKDHKENQESRVLKEYKDSRVPQDRKESKVPGDLKESKVPQEYVQHVPLQVPHVLRTAIPPSRIAQAWGQVVPRISN